MLHPLRAYFDLARARVLRRIGWYAAATAWLLLAIAFGAYAAGQLSALQRADLLAYLGGFLGSLQGGLPPGSQLMRAAIVGDGRLILLGWILALSLVGVFLSWLSLGVKGFSIGFSAAFLLGELGPRGLALLGLGVLPPALIVLPSLMLLCEAAMGYVGDFYHARWRGPAIAQAVMRFAGAGGLALAGIVLAAIVEAYFSPLALHLLWPYVGG
ncbi:MAG: stage II sporulation protein M [Thermaerobacter sp.]|nr:stage II sporulation protein M [Thermaerobacter sp.]